MRQKLDTTYSSFKDLDCWQAAHQLTLKVYRLTNDFPKEERYGITSQLQRAASSVAANIVEGYGRHSNNELVRFLYISLGSLEETRYFLILSSDLSYIEPSNLPVLEEDIDVIKAQLFGFIKYLQNKNA